MMAVPEAFTLAGPCPSDEEIAAFIDGKLRGEERERLINHLAACKSCYEVFAGVMSFEEEAAGSGNGGRLVPFPVARREEKEREEGRRREKWPVPRWAAAAAAVLALGIVYEGYRTLSAPPPTARSLITVAGLTEPLISQPEAARNLYQAVRLRGDRPPRNPLNTADVARDRPSFMAGVFLVDLRLASQTRDPQATGEDLLQRISGEIEDAGYAKDLAESYRRDALQAKESAAFVRQIETELPRREAALDRSLVSDSLAFGKWAEACRIAAVTRTPEVFTSRSNRRFLSHVLDQKQEELAERGTPTTSEDEIDQTFERKSAVVKILQQIEADWKPGDPPQSYEALGKDLTVLIRRYDR